jgi:hypothetical protein
MKAAMSDKQSVTMLGGEKEGRRWFTSVSAAQAAAVVSAELDAHLAVAAVGEGGIRNGLLVQCWLRRLGDACSRAGSAATTE